MNNKQPILDTNCIQCGSDQDLLVAFTAHKVCGKCTRKNHKNTKVMALKPILYPNPMGEDFN